MSFEEMFGHRGAGTAADRFGDNRRNKIARSKRKALSKEGADPYATTSGATNLALSKQKTRLGKAGKSVLAPTSYGRKKGEFSNPTVRF